MLRAEALELWREALSAAEAELSAGRAEAQPTIQRLARSIADATRDDAAYATIHETARLVERAEDGRLHIALEALRQTMASAEPSAEGEQEQSAILIVDDDAVTRRILDRAMASTGRRIIHAATAAEAQRAMDRERLGLVLLDLVLPDADGRNLLLEIRSTLRTAGVPVYVLSGQIGTLPRAECLALGADGYFEKPFDPQMLAMELRAALQQAETRRRQGLRDPLTGLPNRAALGELYETLSAQAARSGRPLTLALIDLDGLKTINDSLGHAAGDAAIRHFGRILRQTLRGADVLARWAGDEFVALLAGADRAQAAEVLDRCQQALRSSPVPLSGGERVVSFSAGVADVRPGTAMDKTMAEADRRAYTAKALGRGRVASDDPVGASAQPTVLLAEDDAVTATIVRHRLGQANLQVVHAPDGQAAWEVLQTTHVSMAILDVQMPGMDGIEVLRRIRAEPRLARLPVLVLTGVGNEHDLVRAFDAGANDYVAKPFSPVELVKRVQRLVKP